MSNVRHHRIITMRIVLSLLVAACVFSGCGGGDATSDGTDIPFTTIASPCNSNVTASEGVVARSQGEFSAVWDRCYANTSSPPPPPVIDFDVQQVIGFFLGVRPDGCHSVSITRINQATDRLVVVYKERVAGTLCTQALVYPAHLVMVPKSQLQVEFVTE
jgi:hypothetical protein